jgi:lipopolysaccharide/colanic/teichoic acid biosynthesis glycosyltransferase
MIKRSTDLVGAFLGLTVLSPLLLVIAILVKVTSPGPVFYRGVRTGRHGRQFRIFKFRTMVENAEVVGGPTTAQDDERVTTVGRVLRRWKLDELPQLLNVIKGDMSLVGPRPEVSECTRLYTGDELLILSVRPGLTDFASIEYAQLDRVVGREQPFEVYKELVLPRKNLLRIKYVHEQSFVTDMKLIFKTLLRIVRR